MRTIDCVVLDLDGTLLTRDKTISERNLEALEACREKGIPIVIATGRPPRAVRHLLVTEALTGFVIYLDGALTVYESRGVVYEHRTIPTPISTQITHLVLSLEPHSTISFEVEDAWYCLKGDVVEAVAPYPLPQVADHKAMQTLSPTKIIISGFPNWERVLRPFDPFVQIQATIDGALIQIFEKSVSKESALSRVLDALGIKPEKVMVFGDGPNDLGLFAFCGYPVAMGNAMDLLKRRAKYVTATNDQDGVAAALHHLGII
ncbi:Cof-type HAD-IIB family hydrolase [Sulfobacillus harzensis]|uniref:HAD family hydrolase n=1 Tax=Sulfobacillus harzensis TaxID=2729629 RepID=A0A7Y0L5M7_9FIRM|nr:Cof-type HAD-IIB family hydrolase [Sulfobacillus harzensis]NMP23691.1 HAD family hydrolase [Sulfobacillus harzensis]